MIIYHVRRLDHVLTLLQLLPLQDASSYKRVGKYSDESKYSYG